MASKQKTSFKTMLSAGSSNPMVNLQAVRQQRQRLEQLKQPSRPAVASDSTKPPPAKRPAVARAAPQPPPAERAGQAEERGTSATTALSAGIMGFVPAAAFWGARPGYVFKKDAAGLGYYRDVAAGAVVSEPAAMETQTEARVVADKADASADAGGASSEAAAAGSGGALPADFFDNPQQDPANRGKAVAATRKEQTLQEEMDEFNRLVSVDLEASAAADVEDLEDEAVASMRDEAWTQVLLEERVEKLKQRLVDGSGSGSGAGGVSDGDAAHASGGGASGPLPARAGEQDAGAADEDEDEDEDEEDDGGLSLLDWRTKAF